jgi:1,2-diacylglycerol 3-alpha-glucosyltransferase
LIVPAPSLLPDASWETLMPEYADSESVSLRVGLFTESFHPVQNGVTVSVQTLISGLRALGHHACVFAPAHQEQRERETNVLRFPSFVSLFNKEYPLAYPFFPRLALTTHFSRLKFDIVHTHTPFVLGLTGANLALSRGIPLVTTFHTLYSQYTHYLPLLPEGVTQTLLEYYLPWYYNRVTEIICPSEVAAKHLRDQGVERPIEIIPTGIALPPPEKINADARQKQRQAWGIAPETPILLYAGRLAKEKNLDWLLEVVCRVKTLCPDVLLLLAGGGSAREELEPLAETLGIGASVRFLGAVPHREMVSLFAASDVFVFPSLTETQGLVIGEARAAGLPCVVADAGGAPETVAHGEDGFRIPADQPEAFAQAVARILHEPNLRETLRTNALARAHHFTPERMIDRVIQVYERALAHPPPPDPTTAEVSGELDWAVIGQAIRSAGSRE